ncbi:MAG TPA: hypothetical protein VFV95_08990 [Vicinamibacterales bacterium]|nr:hypothetical protein [Vicinamibacterales bacterium]
MRAVLGLLLTAAVSLGAAQAEPTKILFIGNSLTFSNDGLWLHLERLAAKASPSGPLSTGRSVFGGAYFKTLWNRPEPREAIRTGGWDVVVLQEDLPETRVEDFRDYARRFVNDVRQAGARPVLLMAWAYKRLGWISMAEIERAHRDAAMELGVDVAPVGVAWELAAQRRPELDLYKADREHPSLAGTYLATAVVYATVFAKDPAPLEYVPAGVSRDDAAFLRRMAFESLQNYRARG